MRHLLTALRVSLVLSLAAAAFVLGAEPASDAAAVLRHSAAVSERNALIAEVRVTLASAARVFVEYDHPQAGRYRTPLSEPGAAHVIPLVRLRPETTYDYTIFVVDGSVVEGSAVDGAAAAGADAAAGPGGRFTTGALPRRLAAISMQVSGRSSQPLILSGYRRGDGRWYFVFWDEVGATVWYYVTEKFHLSPIAQLPDGNFVYLDRERITEITPLGEIVTRIEHGGAVGIPHHEVTLLADGRLIYPSREFIVIDDSANGGPAEATFGIDTLRVWDRASGRFEQVWDPTKAWDIRDPAQRVPDPMSGEATNWTHINSLSIGPRGNLIVSARSRNQVVSLSADLRAIEWQLHGPDSDYRFPKPADRFYGQHTAQQLDNGNLLLFDNGRGRPDAEGGAYSRALELRLDEAAGTAVKVWEYRPTPDIYSVGQSSAYRLSNGNTLINFGVRTATRTLDTLPLTVVEVDAAGNEVFRVVTRQWYELRPRFPRRYRASGGIESIMGETMLRPPAAAPEPFADDYYLAQELAGFRALEAALDGRQRTAGGVFDLYLAGDRLVYAKEPCARADFRAKFFLHVVPASEDDLAAGSREQGFDNLDFWFQDRGTLWEGACLAAAALPEYEIARVFTGQFLRQEGQFWSVEFPVGPAAQRYREARAAIRSGAWGEPVGRAAFDLYRDGRVLAYHKEPCVTEDLRERFFLHVIPADARDLPPQDRRHGFENLGFGYREHGVRLGEACVALVPLPEYAIAGLRTGQFISGQGQLWAAEIAMPAAAQEP